MSKRNIVIVIGCVFFTFILLVGGSVGGYLVYKEYFEKKETVSEISGEEGTDVMANIIKKNPESAFSDLFSVSATSSDSDVDFEVSSYLRDPENRDFNFSYSKSSIEYGPAVSSCEYMSMFDFLGKMDSYEYYDEDKTFSFSSKMVSYDKSDNVIMYFLSTDDGSYEYFGGKYAVQMSFGSSDTVDEYEGDVEGKTSDEEVTNEDIADAYFSDDAKVEKVMEGDELKYYIVTEKGTMPCDADLENWITDEENETEIVTKYWVDPETYEILKEEIYLGEVKDENLLARMETSIERKEVNYEDVSDNFKFDLDTEVREIEYDSSTEDENKEIRKSLVENEPIVLMPMSNKVELSYASAPFTMDTTMYDYFTDRDFYAEGEAGDAMYDLFSTFASASADMFTSYQFTTSYYGKDDFSHYELAVYSSDTDKDKILENYAFLSDEKATKIEDMKVTIDGKKVDAGLYEIKATESEGEDDPFSDFTQYIVIFTYKRNTYAVSYLSDESEKSLDDFLNFKSYDTKNTDDLDAVMKEVEKANEDFYGDF